MPDEPVKDTRMHMCIVWQLLPVKSKEYDSRSGTLRVCFHFFIFFFGYAFLSCILLMYKGEFLRLPHSPVHLFVGLFVCLKWIVANHAVFIIPNRRSFVSVWGTLIILILFTILLHINFVNMIEICIPACWFFTYTSLKKR